MVYRASGVLITSSGVSIAFVEFHENAGNWTFEVKAESSYPTGATNSLIKKFIGENNLQYQVALITIHADAAVLSISGASVAAAIGLPIITDLPALDIELGGNGEFYSNALQKLGLPVENINVLNKTICIAFMGIMRWREEYNFLSFVTGASRNSIGGAVWLGQDA